MMTPDERRAKLLTHPDTIEIEIGGETLPWILGKVTFRLAKDKGFTLGGIIQQMQTANGDLDVMMDAFGKLVYAGALPFDETLVEDDLTDLVSIGDMKRLAPVLTGALQDVADEAADEVGKGPRAAQAKRDRAKRAR